MIITEICCNNFFRFYGECVIECITNANRNVTVIRGENGTGKTTMLNAFYWCFYGDVTPPLYLSKMLNELVEHELEDGKSTSASVGISFTDKGIDYTALRRRTYIRRGDIVTQLGDEEFTITYKNQQTGNVLKVPDPSAFFKGIIPSNLRGFFFFDGERIDRLAKIDGRDEIKQAILEILGLTKLENLRDHFQKLESELTKEQKRYLTDSGRDLTDEYEALCAQRDKLESELANDKENIRKVNNNIDRISEFLSTFNSASINALENERKTAERFISSLEGEIREKNRELLSIATKDFKNFLISFCFDDIYGYLEGKREKGELPSDIKEQFIEDLLQKHMCICERELIEGTPSYEAVQCKKTNAGRTELDDAYHKITAYIRQQKEAVQEYFYCYHGIQEEIMKLEQQKESQQRRISEIKKEFDNSTIEQVRSHEEQREQFNADLKRYQKSEIRHEVELETLNKKIEQKNKEIQGLQVKGEQAKAFKKRRDTVIELAQLNQEIRAHFMDMTRTNLDECIREVFDSMKEKPYRFARLTDDFVLEITNDLDNDDDRRVLSTGEGQVASLAFIASLVSYAREKVGNDLISDFSGGDFPIVMDSPFGNLSAGHKQNVAREIGNLASQVIVVVSDEQWSSVVEQNIMPRVSAIYKMSDGAINDQRIGEHTIVRRQQ